MPATKDRPPTHDDLEAAVRAASGYRGWTLCPECGNVSVHPGTRECIDCTAYAPAVFPPTTNPKVQR